MVQGRKHFHNSLRKHRKMMGYTLKDVAWLLEMKSTNRLSQWERGITQPNLTNALKLCVLYRTLVDQLFFEHRNELRDGIIKREQLLATKKKEDNGVAIAHSIHR
jgi:DNA-binding XRE family transcriptional regulator